ncbi:MAG: glycosyltransferase family 2 protein [Mucilaginibacter sp.]|jgi:glycosyltransferase involved in cell wall biosynthesis|uniref:glycosyltransferase family 2 protein n=1 Tax=Mucilaginibacter sp. TaxID=1882438 RepID=UPI0035696386
MDKDLTMGSELISIIMPAYNASAFIKAAISSVQRQGYKNWELIVVDDGSTDHTASIVKELQQDDSRIIYYRQSNQRLGAARNSGFRLARGAWIAFLDADDLWMEDKLEAQIQSIRAQNGNIDVIFTAGYYLRQDKCELAPYNSLRGLYTGKELYKVLLKHNHIPVLSVLIKRTFCKMVGWQDTLPVVFGNEDWDYWLRACKANGTFLGMEDRFFKYRVHDNGMSAKAAAMSTGACYVVCKNYDKAMLCPEDQTYHQTKILKLFPFIAKRAFKTTAQTGRMALLLIRMIMVTLPLLLKPRTIFRAFRTENG